MIRTAVPPTSAVASPPCKFNANMAMISRAKRAGMQMASQRFVERDKESRSVLSVVSMPWSGEEGADRIPLLLVPRFMSRRIIQYAVIVVTAPMTITSGMLACMTSLTGIPAASAVSFGAP
ncbi:hypothetical protein D3C80_1363460 [compost metagenome]